MTSLTASWLVSDAPAYADLTPDRVLDAVESLGLPCDGRLLALNSFENRVYQLGQDERPPLIAKFYRPGRWSDAAIVEEHAFTLELAAREISVVPPLVIAGRTLHAHAGHRLAVFPRQGGRAPELDRPGTFARMGRFLGRLHAVGALKPFTARPPLNIASFGEEPRDFIVAGGHVPPDLMPAWHSVVDQALDGVRRAFERAGHLTTLRLHGDLHPGNVLWLEDGEASGPHAVDFDDSRSGPAIQDLWMLLAGDAETMGRQLGELLGGYEQFRDFDDRELFVIEALRTLRLIHYSAWIARRWNDPAFPAAFPWFGTPRYWQDRILELREQIPLMDEAPIRPL